MQLTCRATRWHYLSTAALLSLLLNGALATQLYRLAAAAPAAPLVSLEEIDADQLNPPHPLLNQTLLPTSERAITAQQLKLRLWTSYPRSSDHYWQADYRPLPARWLAHRRSWLAASRTELLELFGPTAVYEPLFSEFFFPLRELLPYLPSAAQQRVHDHITQQLNDHRQTHALLRSSALLALLTPPQRFEHQLRHSATAERLRSSNVALSEEQFRALLPAAERYRQLPTAAQLAALQQTLETLLEPAVAQQLLEQLRDQP